MPWAEAVQRVLETEARPLSADNASLSGPLERIVARAMSRDRDIRYRTAADVAVDLREYLAGRGPAAASNARENLRSQRRSTMERLPAPIAWVPGTGEIFIATLDGRVVGWSATIGGEQWATMIGHVRTLAATADGRILAAGLDSGAIELLDAMTGTRIGSLSGHEAAIYGLAFNGDGRRLASASADGAVRIWDIAARHLVNSQARRGNGTASLAWLADARLAVVWDDGGVEIVGTGAATS